MPIPTFDVFMRPVLEFLADDGRHHKRDIAEAMALRFGITPDERAETVSSGSRRFVDRVDWAVTYMAQAGLVERPRRAVVQITERGRKLLGDHAGPLTVHELRRFREFQDFESRTRRPRATVSGTPAPLELGDTPAERIAEAVTQTHNALAVEIIERVVQAPPDFLERLILQLLTAMGYGGPAGAAMHLGKSNDEGVDGVIRQDPLGLDEIYVQAKRYGPKNNIGRPELQAFVGALHGKQSDRGIFVTTSRFTKDARDYVERVNARIVLIDGAGLGDLMVRYGIGVQAQETFTIKRIDEDFFE